VLNKYLLEIGTEELPYKFISSAMSQLKTAFEKLFEENKVEYSEITTYGTPRRLTVVVEGVSDSQPDMVSEIKGPPANIAFDSEGKLTGAGMGFAKKCGVSAETLVKKQVGNVEYVFAEIKQEGKQTAELLEKAVPEIILNIQGARFMRWANLDIKFSRPIRWIVSLFGDKEVSFKIGNAVAGRTSRTHRFAKNKEISVQNADTYLESLYQEQVIVDQNRRKKEIKELIIQAAASKGGTAAISEELLDEVTNLVEWATPVIGTFDEKYLKITEDVIVCVLAHHQRYFPVFDKDGKLLNYFITIANHDSSNIENIKKGNEKVVKPRLDDAIFFYNEDTKRSMTGRVEDLKGVTFQKGLGNLYEKTLRIANISGFIAEKSSQPQEIKEKAEKAALLCKADLLTNLVREFTELQGIIGGDYAKLDGEDTLVWQGVREHYMPVSADGEIASSITGQIVGIADKIDTICGVFALGKAPTGSADPLGLRRASLGIINTVISKNLPVNLNELINHAVSIQPLEIQDKEKLCSQIQEFISLRFKNQLVETYKNDLVDAVFSSCQELSSLIETISKIEKLKNLVAQDCYKSFHEAANRILKIIKNQNFSENIDENLFVIEEEKLLWQKAKNILPTENIDEIIEKIKDILPQIEMFFEKVLVMDKDEKIKQNRINMLGLLSKKFLSIADFTKIVY